MPTQDSSRKTSESNSTDSNVKPPASSKWQWLHEKALFPLVLVVAGLVGVNTAIINGTHQDIRQLSNEYHNSVILRDSEKRTAPNEEAGENPLETFYDEIYTHGTVEEESRLLLEAKLLIMRIKG